jgi:hypothetical protein
LPIGELEELVRRMPGTGQLPLDLLEQGAGLEAVEHLRPLHPSVDVQEVELVVRRCQAVVGVPRVTHQGPLEPVEDLAHHLLAAARVDPIDDSGQVHELP